MALIVQSKTYPYLPVKSNLKHSKSPCTLKHWTFIKLVYVVMRFWYPSINNEILNWKRMRKRVALKFIENYKDMILKNESIEFLIENLSNNLY